MRSPGDCRRLDQVANSDVLYIFHAIATALQETDHIVRTEVAAALSPPVTRIVMVVSGMKEILLRVILGGIVVDD